MRCFELARHFKERSGIRSHTVSNDCSPSSFSQKLLSSGAREVVLKEVSVTFLRLSQTLLSSLVTSLLSLSLPLTLPPSSFGIANKKKVIDVGPFLRSLRYLPPSLIIYAFRNQFFSPFRFPFSRTMNAFPTREGAHEKGDDGIASAIAASVEATAAAGSAAASAAE